ncbi:MAG TPA: hypothetical protein VEW68_06865 [Patescibacteria group bacterium]|nr:hypothetical protein [Patescibacteria group bacterium]
MAVHGNLHPAATAKSAPAVVWTLIGVTMAGIWAGVVLAGIYAPDFVSGSQHEHLKLVAGGDWIWGLVASAFVLLASIKGIRAGSFGLSPWLAMSVGTVLIWAAVALVSAFAPVWTTGSDPTIIPAYAMGVPILGTFLTWFLCTLVRTTFEVGKA